MEFVLKKRFCLLDVIIAALIASFVSQWMGCGPTARAVEPISSSHSQLTATDYDAAEAAFAGGALMPSPYVGYSDAECQDLLDKRDALLAVVAGLGGLTGAGGLVAVLPEDASRDMRLGFGVTAVGLASLGTALVFASKSMSGRFEANCMTEEAEEAGEVEEVEKDGGVR